MQTSVAYYDSTLLSIDNLLRWIFPGFEKIDFQEGLNEHNRVWSIFYELALAPSSP
jgi:hypothetical protein